MSLQAGLDAFKAAFRSGKPSFNAPHEIRPVMERATAELVASGAASALKVGDRMPAFTLNDPGGNTVSSAGLLAKGPLSSASIAASGVPIATWNSRRSTPRVPRSRQPVAT